MATIATLFNSPTFLPNVSRHIKEQYHLPTLELARRIQEQYNFPTLNIARQILKQHEWFETLHRGMELLREEARRLIPEWDKIEPHDARWIRLGAEVCSRTTMSRERFERLRWRACVLEIRAAADIKDEEVRRAEEAQKELVHAIVEALQKKDNPKRGRRSGRRKKEEKDSAQLTLAALAAWHVYNSDGSVTNPVPATNAQLQKSYKRRSPVR